MAEQKIGLVYGGGKSFRADLYPRDIAHHACAGNVGLMGAVASTVAARGGDVVGVIPKALAPVEISGNKKPGVQEIVPDMHTRKQRMSDLSDAYIALPGGFGTFEELLEVICWSQIGIHDKPIGILNINGFYDPLLKMFDTANGSGFISDQYAKSLYVTASTPEGLLKAMKELKPPAGVTEWDQKSI